MPKNKEFDPLAYIESAFLDTEPVSRPSPSEASPRPNGATGRAAVKFKKTALSAPRPRRAKEIQPTKRLDESIRVLLDHLPKNIEFLSQFYNDAVTSHYYNHEFKESREELIHRLLDPEVTLEEVSRLLGVCPATVRRYTNRGWIEHHRTKGGQRRFRLSDVVKFVDRHGRLPEP